MPLRAVLAASFLSAGLAAATPTGPPQLGHVDFPTSGAAEAQAAFLRGVLLLHSFEYEDAREDFIEAQEADPGFALAYWGEAMTHNHPLWREQDREAARAALEKLASTAEGRLARAPSEREKGYLRALEALYGDGDKESRDLAYAEAMRVLSERFPDDLEAASFHALSILGTAQGVRDFRTYMRAAAVAEEVFARSPDHPGAAHYLIHSYDDPVHAPLGLRAARVYASIAPAASHAQHMISHIHVALGRWRETASSNVKSFAVSEERARRKGLPEHRRNHHALHWLEYANLQLGRYDEARRQLSIMAGDAEASGSSRQRWYYARMRAAYVVESRRWHELPASLDLEDVGIDAVAADLFATGLAACRRDDLDAAKEALDELERRALAAEGDAEGDSANELRDASIMRQQLAGLVLLAAGSPEAGLARLHEAAEEEAALPYAFGPPAIVKPTHELLGEVLLELGRHDEARAVFERALDRAPRRSLALLGLARAAEATGDAAASSRAYTELAGIWSGADDELRELAEVRGDLPGEGTTASGER